jgi:peptidoglycan/LPS O-acetylase OafA/YrhL
MTNKLAPRKTSASALAASGAFLVLTPVLIAQVHSEWGQVAFALLAALGFGFYLGHAQNGRSPVTYISYGAILGVLLWLALLIAAKVFYPHAIIFPGTWFVRFGLGSALVLAGAAMLGDQTARGRSTSWLKVLASLIGIASGLLTIVSGG